MAQKWQTISELAADTSRKVTHSPEEWCRFLTTAARFYKAYDFDDQLLIYAQKPDATACADMSTWNNKLRRWVNAGSTAIALIRKGYGGKPYGGGNLMKPRSGRTIPLYFKVSPEEKEIIEKKMAQLGIHNQRAYLRKMAVDGYAVQVDMSDFKALVSLLRNCANNLNQIAKRVNSTGNLYQEDVADLQERYRELWGAVSTLLGKLSDL